MIHYLRFLTLSLSIFLSGNFGFSQVIVNDGNSNTQQDEALQKRINDKLNSVGLPGYGNVMYGIDLGLWLNDAANITAGNQTPNESWVNNTGMYSLYHPNRWSARGVFYPFKPAEEAFDKRTRDSKTFRNPDDTFTAVLIPGLHYKDKSGIWRDIDLSINNNNTERFSDYNYSNSNNEFETFLSNNPDKGVIISKSGYDLSLFSDYSLNITDSDGSAITRLERNPQKSGQVVNRRTLSYPEVYQGITQEIIMLKRGIEFGLKLDNPFIVQGYNNQELTITQEIPLPSGWYVTSAKDKVMQTGFQAHSFKIMAPGGKEGFVFNPVVIYDGTYSNDQIMKEVEIPSVPLDEKEFKGEILLNQNKYFSQYNVEFAEGKIIVSYSIPTNWLLEQNRAYPVYIDPVVELLTGYTLYTSTASGMPYNTFYHDQRYDFLILASDMTSLGITTGTEIQGVSLYCYETSGQAISSFRIRTQQIASTTLTSFLTSGWALNYGPSNIGTPSAGTWYSYTLSPSVFTTTNNLAFNVSRDNSAYTSGGGNYVRGTISSRAGYGYSDSGLSWPYDGMTFTAFDYIPCLRITYAGASLPPNVQDCDGAIPLCFSTYSTVQSYTGTGNYPSEIPTTGGCPGNCMLSGEKNDVWYTFTVQSSGTLNFTITPVNSADDYDWAVYNLTNANCSEILTNPSLQTSCNWSATPGTTGPTGGSGLTCGGAADVPYNANINVTAGQVYVVNVSNYSSTQYGYSITFGGTAQVVDNTGPFLNNVQVSPACGQNQVTIRFNENIQCSSVQASDFSVTGPGGPYSITSVWSSVCSVGGSYDRDFTLTVNPAFTSGGTYTISLVPNSVSDICSHPTGGQTLNFSVTGVSATASAVSNVSCFGGSNGSATASGSGGTPPYTYLWSNGSTSASPSGLAAGTYTVTVRDNIGVCAATASVTITQPTQLTSSTSKTNVSCFSGTNGTATITPSGGTPGYTYSWSSGQTTSSISGLSAGTYNVTVTDSRGCTTTNSVTITQPTQVTATISSSTNVSCNGGNNGSATVTAGGGTPGYTYSWSNGGTTSTIAGLTAGTYTVTVRDANNCSRTASVTITQPTLLTSSISASTQVTCTGGNNGSATVTQSGGTSPYTYLWSNGQTTVTATNLSAGTYSVTVRDANNCTSTSSVTITQPTAISVTITKTNVSCNGGNNGTATASPSGGTPGYTYTWSNGQTTQTATGLSAGTYTVTVRDANNCTTTQNTTITQPSGLSSNISSSSNVACNGGSNGTATVSASGGTPSYTYTWSNGQTTATATNLIAGTYTVTVRDANNCTSTTSVTITQPTTISVTITKTNVSCNGGSTGSATATPSGGTPGYTYSWTGGQTTQTASNLAAGTYTVTVRDVNNCSTTASVTITQPTSLSVSMSQTNVSCNGGNNGTASATPGGGTPAYTYSWSNGQTNATATGLTAGTYTVTVRDANNCSSTQSVTITQPAALSATTSATNTSCFGGTNGTATATPSGGTSPFSYSWFPGGQATQTATNLAAGSYSVTVTDNRGCTYVTTANVGQPPALSLTTSKTDATCGNANGSASVTVSGGTPAYTYTWSNGGTTSTITSLLAGTYTVTVRDANNCSNTASVAVNNTGAPSVNVTSSTNVTCFGGNNGAATISASGGTPGYTYLWSNGATGTSISNVIANTYSVTVTDALGCVASTSIVITQPTAVIASITGSSSPLCFGSNNGSASVSASGGTPGYTYTWSNGQTTSTATNLAAGTYSVTVRDVNNCSATASVTITQPTQLNASISSTSNVSCNGGTNGSATVSPSGGTPAYTYIWSQGSTTATATNLSAGTYTVTVRDANNCSVTRNVTITQPAALSATTSSSGVSCNGGNNGSATATPSGGTPSYTYLWTGGQTTATATNLAAGTYNVTVTDANSCTTTASVTVTQPTTITSSISSSTQVSCNGGTNGTATATGSGGTPSYTYTWSNGQTTATATNLAAGIYTVTVRDANNCSSTSSVTITQPTAITASITSSNVSCNGGNTGNATASPSGGTPSYTFLWSNGQTTSTATSLIAGTYTVTVRDANNCSTTASVTITQPAALSSSISSSTQVSCNGGNNGSATVTPSGGTPSYTYTWSNGQTTVTATNLVAGTYTVTVRDANNCTSTAGVTITQPTQLNVTTSATSVLCNGGSTGSSTATPSGGTPSYTYLWSNGQTTSTATNLAAGTYTVTVRDANNCSTTASVTITQPTTLTSSISGQTQVLCFSGSTGTASVTQSGGTPAYTYLWSNGQTTSTATGLSAGIYTVTVRDANLCTSVSSVTITQPTQLASSISSSTNVTCNGLSNGTATVTPAGGTSPYTYFWSTGQAVGTVTGLSANSYTVTVTDNNGCTSVSSVTITQPAVLTATTSIAEPTCNGGSNGSATATPTGGTAPYSYNWFPGGGTTQTITNLSSGIYQVTVTDNNSCTYTTTANVTQPALLSLTTSMVDATCGNSNGSASVSVSGGTSPYTYLWSTGGTTSSISSIPAGSYSVTVTDAQSCTNNASVSLSNSGAPTITLLSFNNVSCNGSSNGSAQIDVTGGTPGYTYLWSNGSITNSISGVTANIYSVTVTDAINCQATYNVTITQPAALLASITGFTSPICYGEATGSATANATGGTPSYFYNWSSGATNSTALNLSAGSYTVTVTDSKGCTATAIVNITQPAQVNAIISAFTNVTCNGGNNGSATVSPSGGTSPYTFLWSDGSSNQTATNLSAGNYIVTVYDANNCTNTTSVTINQAAALAVNIPIVTHVGCYGQSTGQATASVSGGQTPYSYLWSNGTATATNPNLAAGTYTVTVTDFNNCTGTNSVTITEPAQLTASATPISNISCYGGNNGSASASGSGGASPYSYSWSNGGSFQNTGGLAAGVHSVTITDINFCQSTAFVTITQPDTLVVGYLTDSVTCSGAATGSIDITPTGGTSPYNYIWSNSLTSEDLNNILAGNYTVTVSDVNLCSAIQSITVFQPSPVTSTFTPVDAHCNMNDGSLTANPAGGTPGYTFLWDSNAGSQTTSTATNLFSGSYDVTITDANSCTAVFTGTVSDLDAASLQFTQIINNNCFGDSSGFVSASITSGGTPPFTFYWSTGSSADSIFNLPSGYYLLTVTDAIGCLTIDSAFVSEPEQVQVTIDSIIQVSCFGYNNGGLIISATGGTPAYVYLWQDFSGTTISTSDSALNLPAGIYYLTVTDSYGCQQTFSSTLPQPQELTASVQPPVQPGCSNSSDGMAVVVPAGGTAPYTFLWDDSLSTANDTVNTLSGPAVYHVTITDINGCTDTDSVSIVAPAPIAITGYVFPAVCSASNGWAYIDVSGGTPFYTFIWSNGSSNDTILNQPSGQYTVTVYDANGCIATETVDILNSSAGNIVVTQLINVNCFGDSSGTISVSLSGGTAPFVYNWSDGSTTDSLVNIPAGIYAVTVTDANNCSSDTMLTLTQPASILLSNFSVAGITCNGSNNGSATVTPSGGTPSYQYLWSTGAVNDSVTNLSAGAVSVTITDANGCVAYGSATLQEPPLLVTDIIFWDNPSCGNTFDGTATADATGGTSPYVFLWSNGDTATQATGLAAGVITVTVTDVNLCTDSALILLTSSTVITDSIYSGINQTYTGFANIINVNGGNPPYTYLWSNGATTANITNLDPGDYYVTIYDAGLCFTVDSVTIEIPLIIPSVITPNSDRINDDFEIVGIAGYPDVSVEIYNRWGDLIYIFKGTGPEYSNPVNRWDGKYQGSELPMGSYVYIILLGEKIDPVTGVVSIVR